MAGHLMLGRRTAAPLVPEAGWYDTGDIVTRDARAVLTIVGRVKRFAKVAGEMVSLAAAETLAAQAWPEAQVAALALPDPRKGQKVVLATNRHGAQRGDLLAQARAAGMAEILVPAEILIVDRTPLMASGKTDYPVLQREIRATDVQTA